MKRWPTMTPARDGQRTNFFDACEALEEERDRELHGGDEVVQRDDVCTSIDDLTRGNIDLVSIRNAPGNVVRTSARDNVMDEVERELGEHLCQAVLEAPLWTLTLDVKDLLDNEDTKANDVLNQPGHKPSLLDRGISLSLETRQFIREQYDIAEAEERIDDDGRICWLLGTGGTLANHLADTLDEVFDDAARTKLYYIWKEFFSEEPRRNHGKAKKKRSTR